MVRRIRVIVSALIVAGIVVAGVATCAADAMAPKMAQMACCKAGHHTCGKGGAPADCCKHNSTPQLQGTAVAKTDSLKAPSRVFLALVIPANPLSNAVVIVPASCAVTASPPVKPLGPPVYIVFSTLLI